MKINFLQNPYFLKDGTVKYKLFIVYRAGSWVVNNKKIFKVPINSLKCLYTVYIPVKKTKKCTLPQQKL